MTENNLLQAFQAFSDRVRIVSRNSSIGFLSSVIKAALLAAALVSWQFLSLSYPSYIVPGLVEILEATHRVVVDPEIGTFSGHMVDTFRRLLIGFTVALIFGGTLGTLMGLRKNVETFLRSWIVLGLSVPSIAIAFILIIALGITELVPILTVIFVSLPFVMLNMWEGSQEIDTEIIEMANSFDASTYQKLRHVLFPQILQYLFPSMFWGFMVAWKVLFIAEVFGAGSGIGYMVSYWFPQQRVDMIIGWVIIPMIFVIVIQRGIRHTEHRMMAWR